MIRSILYATDLGIYAPVVMQHALGMARGFSADLYVIHVVEPMGLFTESVLQSYLDEQSLNQLQQQGMHTMLMNIEQRVLDSFRDDLLEGDQELALIRSVKVLQGACADHSGAVPQTGGRPVGTRQSLPADGGYNSFGAHSRAGDRVGADAGVYGATVTSAAPFRSVRRREWIK